MKYQSGYAFTLLLLLAGCGGGGGSSSDSGTTQLNLAISDAPVDSAQQVCIAVSGLSLKQEGVADDKQQQWGPLSLINSDNNPDYSDTDGCLPDGYTIPTDENDHPTFFYLDLLKYQSGDKHMLLSNAVIPSGNYEQLRLQVEDGRTSTLADGTGATTDYPASYVKDADGKILPLEVPSSEIKLHTNDFSATVDGVLDYQVEFNLRHAMVLPGNKEYYKLKPNGVKLLKADVLSTISGTVDATNCNGDLSNAGVYAYNSAADVTALQGIDYDTNHNGPVLSTLVSHDVTTDAYGYQINYVEAGSYKLALVCNASDDFLTVNGNESEYDLQVAEPVKEDVQVDPTVTTTVTENF